MSGRPWIKQSTSKIDDARLALCSDATQRDYFMLYLLAGRLDADGLFIENGRQLSEDEIAFKIRIKASRLKASIGEMKKARLVHVNGKGPQIVDWQHEQINWREKQAADREYQARHRKKISDSKNVRPDSESVRPDGENVMPLEEEQDKNLVVVVKRVSAMWKELIGDPSRAVQKAISKLASSGVLEQVLIQAVEITSDQGKDTPAYFKGVVANLVNGTQKPIKRGVQHRAPAKTKLGGRAIKL